MVSNKVGNDSPPVLNSLSKEKKGGVSLSPWIGSCCTAQAVLELGMLYKLPLILLWLSMPGVLQYLPAGIMCYSDY